MGLGLSAGTGAVAGGTSSVVQGGRFGEGAAYGATGGAITYGIMYYLRWNNGPIEPGASNLLRQSMQFLGRIVNLPNTAVGLILGGIGKLIWWDHVQVTLDHNAIQFAFNNPDAKGNALTLGNVILYRNAPGDDSTFWNSVGSLAKGLLWQHETMHTYQGAQLGPLYIPSAGFSMAVDFAVHGPSGAGWDIPDSNFTPHIGHGSFSWMERGPNHWPPQPWY
jgi:hypothetical protein